VVAHSDSPSSSIVVGSWDHALYLYSPIYGRVTSTVLAHDDAVSCVATAPADGMSSWSSAYVLSGSWDAQVKLRTCSADEFIPESETLMCEHDVEISAVALASEQSMVLSASASIDGIVMMHDPRMSGSRASHSSVGMHHFSLDLCPITDLSFTSDGQQLVACTEEGSMAVIELRKLTSANATSSRKSATQLALTHTKEDAHCMWVDDSVALTGGERLAIYDLKAGRSIGKVSARGWVDGTPPSIASSLTVSSSGQTVAVGHENGTISVLYNGTLFT
jgi:factor associated with neutral sphingomyelinase activation